MRKLRVTFAAVSVVATLLLAGVGCRTVSPDAEETGAIAESISGPRKMKVQPGRLKMRAPRPTATQRTPEENTARTPLPKAGVGSREPVPAPAAPGEAYLLASGDPIVVTLRGPGQSGAVEDVIDERGFIKVPFIGAVQAVGLSSSELETKIHDLYVPDFYRYMTVSVLVPTQRSYYVNGYVNGPGRYPYIAGITLVRAISAAGGYTNFANEKKVTISRGDETLGPFNLREIEKDPSMDVAIEPGDVIKVPKKLW